MGEQLPHGIGHWRAVVVDQDRSPVGVVHGMAGKMDFRDRGPVEGVEPCRRVAAQIGARDIDVVDVAEQAAARAARQRVEKLRLGHRRAAKPQIARGILDEQPASQAILRAGDVIGDHREGLVGVR